MKMKLTNIEIITMANHINTVNGHRGAKFNYALCINQERCAEMQKAVQKTVMKMQAENPDDVFTEYNDKRLALCEDLADKDGDGNAVKRSVVRNDGSVGDEYVGADTNPEWNERYGALLKEYADAIKAHEAFDKEIRALQDEKAEIDLHMVRFEDVPDTLTREHMKPLMAMILPPEEEKK